MMKAFVGLGNPGSQYAATKHNAGFWVVDELVRRWSLSVRPGKGAFVVAETKDVLLAKPTTGMNGSGVSVKEIVQQWNLDLSDLYIVIDDVDLPLGSLRLKPKGGDGCHRGMESIIVHLGSTRFPRLRLGIAAGDHRRPAEVYVLKPFKKSDQPEANIMIQTAADAVEYLLKEGMDRTMNRYNLRGIN